MKTAMKGKQAILADIEKSQIQDKGLDIRPGFTVRIHQKIKEGEEERIQIFEGLVIAVSGGGGLNGTFTVRKIVEGIGVEKVFPMNSNTVAKIEVKRASKVRRAKLYYMRDLKGRAARLRETDVKMREKAMEESAAQLAEQKAVEEQAEAAVQ